MQEQNCATKIATYIENNKISARQASADTGIDITKLTGKSCENLSATELLVICAYLNITPESLRN